MTESLLLSTAESAIAHSISLAQKYFSARYSTPSVALNQYGKIAGSAHLQKNLIKLNKKLFIQNHQAFISQVIPHEVAHILCYQQHGRVKPHGSEWQCIMREVFGVLPEVRHNFDVNNIGMKEFAYQCDCSKLMLSAIRHNKVRRGVQQYRCQKCLSVLQACMSAVD